MDRILNSRKTYAQMALCSLIALLLVIGCKKQELVSFNTDLALNSKIVRLADSAATTRIQVFADDAWQVSPQTNDWLTIDKTNGSGKSEFLATVTSNKNRLPRALEIYVSAKGKKDTIVVQQRGLTPTVNIVDPNINAVAGNGKMKTLLNTNVPFDLLKQDIVYTTPGQANWLTKVTFNGTYLLIDVASSASPAPREATLKLSYLDALGATVKDSVLITQSPVGEYQNATAKDFSYIKTLPSGIVNEDIYLEGIVLVDKGNPNTALNPNSATNKHTIDKTESAITVYVQSLDGKSGLRLRMQTPGDHIFSKNEKIKLWLKNTTISKTSNPATTTISNIPSLNVMEKVESPHPLIARALFMQDLVDDDVYTFIKLKDVEISVSNGSYYNSNEGYEARTDCYPTNIRDINGSSMYMLTNGGVAYRRNGTQVPQGSGTVSGVIVYETIARYGGNIGKYAIRHMAKEDIEINPIRSQGFSNVLVEWDRFRNELQSGATLASNPLTPTIGEGKLSHTDFADLNYTAAAGIYGTNDFNALVPDPSGAKGTVTNGAFGVRGLWNTAKNRGGGLVVKTSTVGISKQVSLQIEGHVAIGAPREWTVEWSTQGNMDSGTWNVVSDFKFQDVVNWTSTLLTQVSGYKVLNFNLPMATLGQPELYIRIKAKNKNAGSVTSDVGGTFNANVAAYFGHISLKYNK